jgi:hypothetical protein
MKLSVEPYCAASGFQFWISVIGSDPPSLTGVLIVSEIPFYIDEVFVKIREKQHYLRRAVDQEGEVVDVFIQKRWERQRQYRNADTGIFTGLAY